MNRFGISRLWRDRRGAVAVLTALMMAMLLGVASLALDMGFLWVMKNRLQSTADATALAGVLDLVDADEDGVADDSIYRQTAVAYAYRNMASAAHGNVLATACGAYDAGTGTVSGSVECADVKAGNWNPATRTFTPWDDGFDAATMKLDAVRVLTHRSEPHGNAVNLFLAPVIGVRRMDVTTSATAWSAPGGGSGVACVLALNPSGTSISISGGANLNFTCGIAAYSGDPQSLSATGGSTVVASDITLVGGYHQSGGATLSPPPVTGAPEPPDPLDHLVVPSYDCSDPEANHDTRVTSNQTLSPGIYCGGLEISGAANVTLEKGVYIIDGKELGLEISGASTVTGDGVTFILTNQAKADISGASTVTLSAPKGGTYAGVLIFQDPNAPVGGDPNQINGGSTDVFKGALYFPNQLVQFQGSAGLQSSCMQIIARDLVFNGDVQVGNNCVSEGFGGPYGGGVTYKLVD